MRHVGTERAFAHDRRCGRVAAAAGGESLALSDPTDRPNLPAGCHRIDRPAVLRRRGRGRDTQISKGRGAAGTAPKVESPLHADISLLAKGRRGVLRLNGQAPAQAGRVLLGRRATGRDQALSGRDQRGRSVSVGCCPIGRFRGCARCRTRCMISGWKVSESGGSFRSARRKR